MTLLIFILHKLDLIYDLNGFIYFQYRNRETSYDARSKKLLEVSKTGEVTIETLQRQRDALELRFLSIQVLF